MVAHLFWICTVGCYLSIYIIYACGFNLVMCVMMLPKFCQFLVHIVIEMVLQYSGKQGYIHKVLKNQWYIHNGKIVFFNTIRRC